MTFTKQERDLLVTGLLQLRAQVQWDAESAETVNEWLDKPLPREELDAAIVALMVRFA